MYLMTTTGSQSVSSESESHLHLGHLQDFIVDRVQQAGLVIQAGSSPTGDQTLPASERLQIPGQTNVL